MRRADACLRGQVNRRLGYGELAPENPPSPNTPREIGAAGEPFNPRSPEMASIGVVAPGGLS
jgi:hypothetical protein